MSNVDNSVDVDSSEDESLSHSLHDSSADYTEKTDEAVSKRLEADGMECWHQPSIPDLANVLANVVRCDETLNPKYRDHELAKELLKSDELLASEVAHAWKTGSYYDVRKLDILQTPVSLISSPSMSESQLDALRTALTSAYEGCALDAFYEYLTENNAKFHGWGNRRYYGKFCSIVQSSGTGKTRLMLELHKRDVCVLYMNIRSQDDKQGYPDRDAIPADILTRPCASADKYRARCYAFFAAVFKVLRTSLEKEVPHWCEEMCKLEGTARPSFFEGLEREYNDVKCEAKRRSKVKRQREAKGQSEATRRRAEKSEKYYSSTASTIMTKYFGELVDSESFPGGEENEPSLVIALDEAHVLHDSSGGGFSRADVLLRTIKEYSEGKNEAVWVVFASTTSKVAHFASPQAQFPSARVAVQGQLLFPPFTQLGWDQNAPLLEMVRPDEVAKAGHILQYGRPLWGSLRKGYSLEDLILLATQKLCGAESFDPENRHQVLAVLAQRFGLDIAFGHRNAVSYVETSVASHLRVCINTTEDRLWSYTTYPSEPILSCAAASLLLGNTSPTEDKLLLSLHCLQNMVNAGVIDIGQIGELVSRFIWLLAKDFFVRSKVNVKKGPKRKRKKVSEFDQELLDCESVSVVGFLKSVFGPEVWRGKAMEKALKHFTNAYINFSHWVSMDYNIRRDIADLEQLPMTQWTLCHWERTSAVQCCHNQPLIDKVIPMYFKPQYSGDQAGVSQILISDKARNSSQKPDLKDIRRDHWSIAPNYRRPHPPYIAILADLGVEKPQVEISLDSPSKDRDTCLRIYAAGLNATTYPFLQGREQVIGILRDLYKRQFAPPGRGYLQNLEDQVRFGASSEPRFMNLKT